MTRPRTRSRIDYDELAQVKKRDEILPSETEHFTALLRCTKLLLYQKEP